MQNFVFEVCVLLLLLLIAVGCGCALAQLGLEASFRRVVPTGGRKPTPGPSPQQPMLHANQMLSLCHRTPPGQGEEMVLWYLGWLHVETFIFEKETFFFLGGGFVV